MTTAAAEKPAAKRTASKRTSLKLVKPLQAPNSEFVVITPEIAAALLEANSVNRKVRSRLVNSYAHDMANGLWRITGEAIKISRTGRLLDGQHRLHAIVQSGASIQFLVVRGLDDDDQKLMDQGAARTAADAVKLAGYKNTAHTATIARWYAAAPEVVPDLDRALKVKISTATVLQVLEQNPDIAEAAHYYSGIRYHLPGSPTALGYTWLQMQRVDAADTNLFYGAFIDLTFKALHDPRKAALRRLQSMEREHGSRSKDRAVVTVSILTRAWNAWRKGEEMSTISAYRQDGKVIPPVKPI